MKKIIYIMIRRTNGKTAAKDDRSQTKNQDKEERKTIHRYYTSGAVKSQ